MIIVAVTVALWVLLFAIVWVILSMVVSRVVSARVNRSVKNSECGVAFKMPPYELATFGIVAHKTFTQLREMCADTGHSVICDNNGCGKRALCYHLYCKKCILSLDENKHIYEAFCESWSGMWRPPFQWRRIVEEAEDLDELAFIVSHLPETGFLSKKGRKKFFVGLRDMHAALTDKQMNGMATEIKLGMKYPGFFDDDTESDALEVES